jgi:DNA-binding PadR family transcriptional regulator
MSKMNKTKYALLGVLNLGSGSGYDIKRFCDSSISHFWNENYAHIYPVLKQMEEEELVTKETECTEGRPAKNIYSITEKGKIELNEWLVTPVENSPFRNEFLLKLFFSGNVHIDTILENIKKQKEKYEKLLTNYMEIENHLKSEEPHISTKESPLWLSSISFGKYQSQAMIEWCIETEKYLSTTMAND